MFPPHDDNQPTNVSLLISTYCRTLPVLPQLIANFICLPFIEGRQRQSGFRAFPLSDAAGDDDVMRSSQLKKMQQTPIELRDTEDNTYSP